MLKVRSLILFMLFILSVEGYSTTQTQERQKEEVSRSFMTIKKNGDKLLLEVPKKLFGVPILMACRVESVSSNRMIAAGQMRHNPIVVKWDLKDKMLILQQQDVTNMIDVDDPIYPSFKLNRQGTILESFRYKTYDRSTECYVIDVTKFVHNPLPIISPFGGRAAPGRLIPTLTSTLDIRNYDQNIELVTEMHFSGRKEPFSCRLHRSFLLLDKDMMRPRLSSDKIGYYDVKKEELSSETLGGRNFGYIKRWRIEPKGADIEAYKQGELVVPKKQIVFYVDSAFPEKWRKYIKLGIEDWQIAFEKIGFKDAIVAKDYPKHVGPYEMSDITKSCFRYVVSDKANAMGNAWVDPRSGEILQGNILWYHGVFSKLYKWRFVQTAANDPSIRCDMEHVEEKVMGDLIRYAAAHEIGHALGLKHNYRASFGYPVDSLRSPTFTATYGTAASIMDYARNNYVAQPKDHGVSLTPPILGLYDIFSIKWGYKPIYDVASTQDEVEILSDWITAHAEDDMYLFKTKNGMGDGCLDPAAQTEALGDDIVKASEYGVSNIKVILDNLYEWTNASNHSLDYFREMYDAVMKQYGQYLKHATTMIGGVYEFHERTHHYPELYHPVSKVDQKAALDFIMNQLLTYYEWSNDEKITNHLGNMHREIVKGQEKCLKGLVDRAVLYRLFSCSQMMDKPFSVGEYLDQITNTLFQLSKKDERKFWIQNLQVVYVKQLLNELNEYKLKQGDLFANVVIADILYELSDIKKDVIRKASKSSGKLEKHYSFLSFLLTEI
ncbi:zinc-dependent metalloprotease [Halosquirtibacter xylanolyticus]|uniref:zinc-dependent metalloprotease n=1 Tax=Halosquirtibacter xylanolyticus TaxID=3374599 RepID=UPI0037482E80|nr:zinc-dependent metalloprotease [Prolixibacteraceae bacterium]